MDEFVTSELGKLYFERKSKLIIECEQFFELHEFDAFIPANVIWHNDDYLQIVIVHVNKNPIANVFKNKKLF